MPLTHLGDMPIATFLREYWQQKPVLIRQAFPDFESPIDGNELAGLALEEEVESRLVLERGDTPWELRQGPFDENTFATLPPSHWTLLVQAVDHWVPEVRELLEHFRFLPDWRVDDIMVSYAVDQGSVGPHFDYYDVFLLQGAGQRRWRLGQTCDSQSPRIEGTALNILKTFDANQDWVLTPGDMLYIPPGVAHWGIAEGDDCLTYSIGFRAPSIADILTEASQEAASQLTNDQRYRDIQPSDFSHPGEISDATVEALTQLVREHLKPDTLRDWFGRYMTSPKYPELEPDVDDEENPGDTLYRHPASRFAYTNTREGDAVFYADGEAHPCSRALAMALCSEWTLSRAELVEHANDERDQHLLEMLIEEGKL